MVVGKDFAKFSNPKYVNKRGSTMTLVRDDAEAAWDIPDSPKQREHSLSFVKENEAENDSDKTTELKQTDDVQSDILPAASTEVNVGVEIVPPPRNIARERPKKAKLVKAIDLVDELSDSAFETVTESDLGKRTDSDMSSGNDSTETHTVSLGFKETFDSRHRNTVSVVTESFDSLASGRAEHRTSSLPPEMNRRNDIPDSMMKDVHFTPLSKSMDSEIAYIDKERVSDDIKFHTKNINIQSDRTNTVLEADIKEQTAENIADPFVTTNEVLSFSDIIITEKDELPKTPPASTTELPSKTNDSSSLDFPRNSDPFMSGFGEQFVDSLNDVDSSITCKQKAETGENAAPPEKQSNEDDTFGGNNSLSENHAEQVEMITSETELSLVSARQNDPMDMVDSTNFEWQSMTNEPPSSDTSSPFNTIDDKGMEINTISSPLNKEMAVLDSVQLNSDTLMKDKPNSPANMLETSELSSKQNDISSEEKDPVSVKIETDVGNESSDDNERQVSRTASLTISKDNLFLDAPPTPMIIVHDSFIREPEAANPFLDIQENENGLPVITEKSESQSSTRSNSFDFALGHDTEESQVIAQTHNSIDKVETENTTILLNENTVCTEYVSINTTEELNTSENDKMADKEEANLHVFDSNMGNSDLFHSFETKQSGFDEIFSTDSSKLPREANDIKLLSETWKNTEQFDSFSERNSGFPQLLDYEFSLTDKKEAGNVNNTDNLTSSSAATLEFIEEIGGGQLESGFPQQLSDDFLPIDKRDTTSILETTQELMKEEKLGIGGESLDSFIKPDIFSDPENFQPLEIQIDLPEKQPQLLHFDDFEDDNAVSVTSPTGISTDSSAISWELINETSPNNVDTNPFQTGNGEISISNDQLINTADTEIHMPLPSNLLDFETGDIQMPQQVNLFDFDAGDTLIPTDERKTSDSSSSKEGDTSWELIDESVDNSNKQVLPDQDNIDDDDASSA